MPDFKVRPTINGGSITQGDIDASAEQTVLEDTNAIPLTDTGVLKWASWANIKAALTTLFGSLYLPGNGAFPPSTSASFMRWQSVISSIGATQLLTIDVLYNASEDRTFQTEILVTCGQINFSSRRMLTRAIVFWRTPAVGGTAIVLRYELDYEMAGTPTVTVTGITDGIRLSISSSGYGGTLNGNVAVIESLGTNAELLTHLVTIT